MAPGTVVKIGQGWNALYRKPGAELTGVITSLSPTGTVARVRMDDVADSYILVDHLEPVALTSARAA